MSAAAEGDHPSHEESDVPASSDVPAGVSGSGHDSTDDSSAFMNSEQQQSSADDPRDRLLYDVFYHAPHFQPASEDGADAGAGAALDDVSEVEWLSSRRRASALSVTAARQMKRVWWQCCRRKATDASAAAAAAIAEDAGSDDGSAASSSVQANWPLLLSPNGDLLAIVKERSITLRGSNHDFAFQQLDFSIPHYAFLASPYPATLTQLAALSLPASDPAAGGSLPVPHPFSRSHARPAAWSLRSELIALAVRENEVAIYALAPLRLVHTMRVPAASSPLEKAAASSALPLGRRRAAARFPCIAALVFRESVCPHTPRGYCPHLLVLCYDGSVHHLHVPVPQTTSTAAAAAGHAATSDFAVAAHALKQASGVGSGGEFSSAAQRGSLYAPHLPLSFGSRRNSVEDAADASAGSAAAVDQQLRQRGRGAKGVVEAHSPSFDDESQQDDARAREYVSFLAVPNAHGVGAAAAAAFVAADFDATQNLLFIASVSLTRERTPRVSVWRVSDTDAPFFFAVACTRMEATPPPKPVQRQGGALRRIFEFVKKSTGAAAIGAAEDDSDQEVEFVPTLADVACSMHLSPDASRVALLDMRGNLNVWLVQLDGGANPPSLRLLDSHRWQDGCPSLLSSRDSSSSLALRSTVLLCDVSWWSSELLLCAYTNGHLILTPLNLPSMLSERDATRASAAFTAPSMHQLHLSSGDSLRRNLLGDRPEGVHGIPTLSRALAARKREVGVTRQNQLGDSRRSSPAASPILEPASASASSTAALVPHRVFLLECERRFLRRRKVWSSVGMHDDDTSSVSFDGGSGDDSAADAAPIHMRRTFRLLSLCQSTPEEFLLAKVEARQYDEALLLAQAYSLNPDIVYQARWRMSPVNTHSLQAYLAPISDEWWVLQQVVERLLDVQGDVQAATLLLQWGLDCTTPERIQRIRNKHAAEQASVSSADDGNSDAQAMASVSEREQTKLCLYRLLFLHYLDRLRALSLLQRVAPPSAALSRLPLDVFLDCDLVSACVLLAEDAQFVGLQILFHAFPAELWLFRREILAAIPDSIDPDQYTNILPMPGVAFKQFVEPATQQTRPANAEEVESNEEAEAEAAEESNDDSIETEARSIRRERDWVENVQLLETMLQVCSQSGGDSPSTPLVSPFAVDALQDKLDTLSRLEAGTLELSEQEVQLFYADRVRVMDARAGQLYAGFKLLSYARDLLHVPGLDSDWRILSDLVLLVYTHGLEKLSLKQYAPLDDFQRLCLVMKATTPNSVVNDLRTKAHIFFERDVQGQDQQQSQAASVNPEDPFVLSPRTSALLRRYMLHIAPSRLDLVHAIILSSRPGRAKQQQAQSDRNAPTPPPLLIPDHGDLISLSIECCYGHSAADASAPDAETLQLLSHIFECLPARSHSDSSRLQKLHRHLDELDAHLTAMETLAKYGQAKPLYFFLTLPLAEADAAELQRWGPAHAAHLQQQQQLQRWSRKHPSLKRKSVPRPRVEAICVQLLESMARTSMRRKSPPLDAEGWHTLLRDMMELRLKVFPFISTQQIHSLVLHCTLASEQWVLSRELMRTLTGASSAGGAASSSPPLMPLDEAERLVLDVAREFLNSAPSLRHQALAQAKSCLNILPLHDVRTQPQQQQQQQPALWRSESEESVSSVDVNPHASSNQLSSPALTAAWQSEFELLDGLQRLESVGVTSLVPIEIRMARDRQLQQRSDVEATDPSQPGVLDLMLRSNPLLHQHGDAVLDVLRSFGFSSDEQQTAVRLKLAEAALTHADYRTSMQMLLHLMEQSPPQKDAQLEQASRLCHTLSQQLDFPAHSAGSTLLKPKLHLLAHTLCSCHDAQQLGEYLREYLDLTRRNAQPPPSQQQVASSDEEESPSPVAAVAPAPMDGDAQLQTAVERSIAQLFSGEDPSLAAARFPELSISMEVGAFDATTSSDSASDAVLLQLANQTCGVDGSLALSYLLSLSDPLVAQSLFDSKVHDESDKDAASSSPAPPTLSHSQRQECVELAMRFFAIQCLLAPLPTPARTAIDAQLAEARLHEEKKDQRAVSSNVLTLDRWEVPPVAALSTCSLELLHVYLEALQAGYDALETESGDASSSQQRSHVLTLALQYDRLRVEAKKSEFMLLHCPNLDVTRFAADAQYRLTSIRQLARGRSTDSSADGDDIAEGLSSAKMLELSVTLCKRYHIPVWEAYMERARFLFESTQNTADLRTELQVPSLREPLLAQPIATYTALVDSVWPRVRGDDLPRITLMVELQLECFGAILHAFQSATSAFTSPNKKKSLILYERNRQRLQEHQELLTKLIQLQQQQQQQVQAGVASSSLDYKQLLSSPSQCMAQLRKLLTEHNIFLVSRLCSKIQHLIYCQQQAGGRDPAAQTGLFPTLKPAGAGADAVNNLIDVFFDVPIYTPIPAARSLEDAEASNDEETRIDSSLLFMLFLSTSLRKHMDTLAAAASGNNGSKGAQASSAATAAAAAASIAAMPSVTAWFAHFDKLLKRLSVPHFTQLACEVTMSGSNGDASSSGVTGFLTRPSKVELRMRLEVAQCALRGLEQLPAWIGVAPSAASAGTAAAGSSVGPSAGLHRSVSSDLESTLPSLSPEAKSLCFDRVAEAHTFLCILNGVFDLGCLHATPFWSQLVQTQGRAPGLYALVQKVLESVPDNVVLQPADCQRIIDKIRVQLESVEYRSRKYQERAEAEEKQFDWHLFPVLQRCVADRLLPERYSFAQAEFSVSDSLETLSNAAALIRLQNSDDSTDPSPCALLVAFSAALNEERNVALFQQLLTFVTAPVESSASGSRAPLDDAVAQARFVRAQMVVVDCMRKMQEEDAASHPSILHATLREQLNGSTALLASLLRSLHFHLLLLRAAILADPQVAVPSNTLSKLASRLDGARSRAAAITDVYAAFDRSASGRSAEAEQAIGSSLAAAMLLCNDDTTPAAWSVLLAQLIERGQHGLLLTLVNRPAGSSASAALLPSLLPAESGVSVYRSLLQSSSPLLVSLEFALSFDAHSSPLPRMAVQHILRVCAMNGAEGPSGVGSWQQASPTFLRALLRHAPLSLPPLVPLAAAQVDGGLLSLLCQQLVADWRVEVDNAATPSRIDAGSLSHVLAVLCAHQHLSHALAVLAEAYQVHRRTPTAQVIALMRSVLKQAEVEARTRAGTPADVLDVLAAALASLS